MCSICFFGFHNSAFLTKVTEREGKIEKEKDIFHLQLAATALSRPSQRQELGIPCSAAVFSGAWAGTRLQVE